MLAECSFDGAGRGGWAGDITLGGSHVCALGQQTHLWYFMGLPRTEMNSYQPKASSIQTMILIGCFFPSCQDMYEKGVGVWDWFCSHETYGSSYYKNDTILTLDEFLISVHLYLVYEHAKTDRDRQTLAVACDFNPFWLTLARWHQLINISYSSLWFNKVL